MIFMRQRFLDSIISVASKQCFGPERFKAERERERGAGNQYDDVTGG